jgi:hypothetical protein
MRSAASAASGCSATPSVPAANWLLRAEYRYLAFKYDRDAANSNSSTSTELTSTSTFSSSSTSSCNNKFDFHMGTIGVAYRFCYCD